MLSAARHAAMAAWLFQGKPFVMGWLEGVQRAAYSDGRTFSASRFKRGSVQFAASEAALAYSLAVRTGAAATPVDI